MSSYLRKHEDLKADGSKDLVWTLRLSEVDGRRIGRIGWAQIQFGLKLIAAALREPA